MMQKIKRRPAVTLVRYYVGPSWMQGCRADGRTCTCPCAAALYRDAYTKLQMVLHVCSDDKSFTEIEKGTYII
jgi:hypothetical protein